MNFVWCFLMYSCMGINMIDILFVDWYIKILFHVNDIFLFYIESSLLPKCSAVKYRCRLRYLTDEIERTMTYICFILKPCDLKLGMHVLKTLLFLMKSTDYTYYTYFFLFFKRLKRVGSVLSRSELDPFLYIWYNTVRTKSGLSPCGRLCLKGIQ